MKCSKEKILKFIDNELNETEKKEFLEHIEKCYNCKNSVYELKSFDSKLTDHFKEINNDSEKIKIKDNFNSTIMHTIEMSSSTSMNIIYNMIKFIIVPAIFISLVIIISKLIPETKKNNIANKKTINISIFGVLKNRSGVSKIFKKNKWTNVSTKTEIHLKEKIRTSNSTDSELHIFDGSFIQLISNCEIEIKDSQTIFQSNGNALYNITQKKYPIIVKTENAEISGNIFSVEKSEFKTKVTALSSFVYVKNRSGKTQKLINGYFTIIDKNNEPTFPELVKRNDINSKNAKNKIKLDVNDKTPDNMNSEELFKYLENKKIDN